MNHITIAGRVEEDPVRKEANGSVVCSFRIASGRTGSKSGRLWIDVDAWGALAGTCYQHLRKGRTIIVAGRLTQKQWSDPETGERRSRYVVTASQVDFVPEAR
jgi:single-strand DNA-binding protein